MLQPIVLLIKDKPAHRAGLGYNIKAEGVHVLEANKREDAVLQRLETLPDLIV